MKLLEGKDVMVGVIDVASDVIETPEQVADTIGTRTAVCAANDRLMAVHQLRPGADGPRGGRSQVEGAGTRRRAGGPARRMIRRRLFRFGAGDAADASADRWVLRAETLALLASLAFTLACNGAFWQQALQGRDAMAPATWVFAAGVGVALAALQFVLMAMVFNRWTARPLLALLILATAFATWYMQRYGVYLDPSMLRNVLRTDAKEASELFALGMVPHLLLYAVLPLALLWRVRIAPLPLLRAAWQRLAWLALGLAMAVAGLLLVFQDFASLMRNHKEMRYLITRPTTCGRSAVSHWRTRATPPARARWWALMRRAARWAGRRARGPRWCCWWWARPRVPPTGD